MRSSKKQNLRNVSVKSELKTLTKKLEQQILAGSAAEAQTAYRTLAKRLDQAQSKGITEKNTVSRKKSRLSTRIAKLS